MQAQATQRHLANIPQAWEKAYAARKRRTFFARLALWGFVAALAAAVLFLAGQQIG